MTRSNYPVSEIYGPTIQGEGPLMGAACYFVRFGGCDYRCVWCDSMFAVDPAHRSTWNIMTPEHIAEELGALPKPHATLVVLSGGNPCLYDLSPLVRRLHHDGFQISIETQGSKAPVWLNGIDYTIISPKGPSSLMQDEYNADTLEAVIKACGDRYRCLKFAIGTEEDFAFARACSADMNARMGQMSQPPLDVFMQPVNPFVGKQMDAYDLAVLMDRYAWLVQLAQQEHWLDARILPQLHVVTWGNQRRK